MPSSVLVGIESVRPNEWKNKIAVATLGINEEGEMSAVSRELLESHRISYEISLNEEGMNTEETIIAGLKAGLKYATGLWIAHHCIESEWLLTQLATIGRRVHGPDQKIQ